MPQVPYANTSDEMTLQSVSQLVSKFQEEKKKEKEKRYPLQKKKKINPLSKVDGFLSHAPPQVSYYRGGEFCWWMLCNTFFWGSSLQEGKADLGDKFKLKCPFD